ncbi:MAG: hypothetical protein NVSMB32_01260 [Actinomycetota bacterium]
MELSTALPVRRPPGPAPDGPVPERERRGGRDPAGSAPVRSLSRFGLTVGLPPGWEGAIFQRPAAAGEQTFPVLHVASFPLPGGRGDFGSLAVEAMRAADVFLALLEDDPASAETPMFAGRKLPRTLAPGDFSPTILQRERPGQAGTQTFFAESGRAFCLYAVLGSVRLQRLLVPRINTTLSTLRIDPR